MKTRKTRFPVVVACFLSINLLFISSLQSDEAVGGAVAAQASYMKGITAALHAQWPHNRTINIVCHGHSVPAGYFATPVVDTFNAYPHLLHKALKERSPYAVINVIVTAIGGECSDAIRYQGNGPFWYGSAAPR